MPPPARIRRGVKDIRTRSGTPDQNIVPYKAYMVITALEMEKFRRGTERQNLIARLKNVSARLRTIDTEKTALLGRLSKLPDSQAGARRVSNLGAPRSRFVGGFKHQY